MERRYWCNYDDHGDPIWNDKTDEPRRFPVSVAVGQTTLFEYDEGRRSARFERPKRNVWRALIIDDFGNEVVREFDRAWKMYDWTVAELDAQMDGESRAYRVLMQDAPALVGAELFNAYIDRSHIWPPQKRRIEGEDGAYVAMNTAPAQRYEQEAQ